MSSWAIARNQWVKLWVLAALVLIPALVWTQNKNEKSAPPPKPAPAAKPAQAPAQHPAPAPAQHPAPAPAQRPATSPANTARPPANNTTQRPTGAPAANNTARPNTNTATRPAPTTTARPAPNTAAKPGANTATRPTTTTTSRPAPNAAGGARTTPVAGGGRVVTQPNGSRATFNSAGTRTSVTTAHGATANFNSRGQVTTIHSPGMTINRGAGGQRTVVAQRTDARGNAYRVVSVGGHRGYVERGFVRNGQPYMRRTYVYGGRTYTRVYGGYYWHGGLYYHYVPAFYYGPAFYGWAYNPWAAPVVFGWGWGPWYPYYGYYFTPYPAYAAPSLWLTDYLISQNLQAAYEARAQADANAAAQQEAAANGQGPVLTPELKQAIADEVRAQIEAERAAAAQPPTPQAAPTSGNPQAGEQLPGALDPNYRTFIVANSISGQVPDGTECSLTAGDVLTRIDDTPDSNSNVKVLVSSSQRNDCRNGTQLSIGVQDLQDMRNHFEEQVNDGMGKLAENQGKGQIPAGPAAGARPVADGTSAPDLTAVAELQKEEQDADQNEKEVAQAAGGSGPGQ